MTRLLNFLGVYRVITSGAFKRYTTYHWTLESAQIENYERLQDAQYDSCDCIEFWHGFSNHTDITITEII